MEIFKELPFYLQENVYGAYLEAQRQFHKDLWNTATDTKENEKIIEKKHKTLWNLKKIVCRIGNAAGYTEINEDLITLFHSEFFRHWCQKWYKQHTYYYLIKYVNEVRQDIFMKNYLSQLPLHLQEVIFGEYLEKQREFHIDLVDCPVIEDREDTPYWEHWEIQRETRDKNNYNNVIEQLNDIFDALETKPLWEAPISVALVKDYVSIFSLD